MSNSGSQGEAYETSIPGQHLEAPARANVKAHIAGKLPQILADFSVSVGILAHLSAAADC